MNQRKRLFWMSFQQSLNTCFSSAMAFNPIDSHGTETYIKSKYIIKCMGKEERTWRYVTNSSADLGL